MLVTQEHGKGCCDQNRWDFFRLRPKLFSRSVLVRNFHVETEVASDSNQRSPTQNSITNVDTNVTLPFHDWPCDRIDRTIDMTLTTTSVLIFPKVLIRWA